MSCSALVTASGSPLTPSQRLPSAPQTPPAASTRAVALAAWQVHLELLFATLHGDDRVLRAERTEELAKRYAARLP